MANFADANNKQVEDFPHVAARRRGLPWGNPVSRRDFFKATGLTLAAASLSACIRKPTEEIVPYVRRPEDVIPGNPLFFASALTLGGVATGVLVESHLGRPTKVEGNPEHPDSLGASDPFGQAAVQILYDPDRSKVVTNAGRPTTWDDFLSQFRAALDTQRGRQGAGLRILTETVTSPSLAQQVQTVLGEFPQAKWHQYEPVGRGDGARAGAQLAFGQIVEPVYRFENADVILSLDADFLQARPGTLRYIREYARRRYAEGGQANFNRLYMVESMATPTGAKADHRLPLRSGEVQAFARALAARLGVNVGQGATDLPQTVFNLDVGRWIDALARDLQRAGGRSLIIPGETQPPVVHAIAHALNQALGNVGQTVVYIDPIEANPVVQLDSLSDLVADMDAGRVDLLVILSGNPVYTAPADLQFGDRLQKVATRVHLGLYPDETAALCQWHIPEAHTLESWGDARTFDGTVTLIQPLIAPLYNDAKTAYDVLAAMSNQPPRPAYDLVRDYWRTQNLPGDFERSWKQALNDGFIANTGRQPRTVSLRPDLASQLGGAATPGPAASGLEIAFRPDPTIYDGRFANSAWLQELHKPINRLTWDNAAFLSPRTARELGLKNEDEVELRYQGRSVRAGVWIQSGHADNSVTAHLGYGRTRAGSVGNGAGFNAYLLRTSRAPWFDGGLEVRKTGETYRLASTQLHHSLAGREHDILRQGTVAQYRNNPNFLNAPRGDEGHPGEQEQSEEHAGSLSIYPQYDYSKGYAWAMTVDQSMCVGCNACVVACQAENNVPTVGKENTLRAREMHWLRIDAYFPGEDDDNPENPEILFQPMYCQHCETAPCEVVCPVTATSHSSEGLNDMVYNRCIGTRYCSQNCPYKVRRFNYLQYNSYEDRANAPEVLRMLPNPDVTVRSRGVMEKCTYCVQRITAARIDAEKAGRLIRDGEIEMACQAACPARVYLFGNLNDPNAAVTKRRHEALNYTVLGELATQTRTTYLAALRNPNPELEQA